MVDLDSIGFSELLAEHVAGSLSTQQNVFQNPEKSYKSGRKQVSHLYSGGTTCDVTGQPRQVEVKLKCKESNR